MTWAATQAKAKFSEVLDKAETEGPQLVLRRRREFVLMTREQHESALKQVGPETSHPSSVKLHENLSEFFRNSPLAGSGIEFERLRLKPRHIEL